MGQRYRAVTERDGESGSWAITVPELDGAFGDSPSLEEAAQHAADIIELALDLPDGAVSPSDVDVEVRSARP